MRIIGAQPGDIADCLFGGNQEACQRVYFGYYLWPRLQRMLEELELLVVPLPGPPGPDPQPWLTQELVAVLLAGMLSDSGVVSDSNPLPAIPVESRLQVVIKFRDGLKRLVREFDMEIEQLQSLASSRAD